MKTPRVLYAYMLLLPVLLLVVAFILYPVISTGISSLFRDVSYLPRRFVGVRNFSDLLQDADFLLSLRFTCSFTVAAVALETLFGMTFALLLNEPFRGRNWLRTIVLIPWAIPTIVSAKIWKLVFDYSYGILNTVLSTIGMIDRHINWLGTPSTAFWSLVCAEVWKTTPFMVIILLAGLQAIPGDLYEQAEVDGASVWRRFQHITLPCLRPVLVIALVFRTIDSLRLFDLVYVLTGGGPGGTTRTLSMLGFEYYSNNTFGRGSAVSIVTFLIVFAVTLIYVRVGRFHRQVGTA